MVDRNWRTPAGELDLVARRDETVVFCEVKARRSERFGGPAEAVTPRKRATIRRLAAAWLAAHRGLPRREIRFDVVTVLRNEVQVIEEAF